MCKADNLLPPCVVTKSASLNFLETSGPVQACNGTASLSPSLHAFGISIVVTDLLLVGLLISAAEESCAMCDLEAFGHECSSSGVKQCEDGIEGVIEHEMCARMSEGCRWLSLYI